MAKFGNPKNGEVYDVQNDNCNSCGFCEEIDCGECPLLAFTKDCSCSFWINKNPEKAAELMGYEYLPDDTSTDSSTATNNAKLHPTRTSILESARRCVCGDREQDYGSPETSFHAIGMFWGTYLWTKYGLGRRGNTVGMNFITPEDVAAMMVLFKMARVATGHGKADNWIDAAGYAACGGEIEGGNQ